MSYLAGEAFRIFVETKFQSAFTALYPTVPIKFKDPFPQPSNAPWSQFWIMPGTRFVASIGRTFVRRTPGLIQMDMFVPQATGHAVADKMAEQAGAIFEDMHFSIAAGHVTRFRKFKITPLGNNGGFYRCEARVGFEHDALVDNPNN